MAKTEQQYYDEVYAAGKQSVDKLYGQKKAADAATIEQINAAIDQASQTAVGQHEQRIAAAPTESRALYDQNAVADAVAKKQVQERLANMGVTDSGLTSSMQTAMAIQKQKADNAVRADEAAKIQAAKNTIDQILAEAETEKANQKVNIESNTENWYLQELANLENTSRQSAAQKYAADQDYAAKIRAAEIEAAASAAQSRYDLVQNLMDANGYTMEQATAASFQMMPSEDNVTNLYYEAISKGYSDIEAQQYAAAGGGESGLTAISALAEDEAINFANGVKTNIAGFETFFNTPTGWSGNGGDGKVVADRVNKFTTDNAQFEGMSSTAKETAKATLIGFIVADTWGQSSDEDDRRIRIACNLAGVDYYTAKAMYDSRVDGDI